MGGVDRVGIDGPGRNAPTHHAEQHSATRVGGGNVGRCGLEVGERLCEHDLGQARMSTGERSIGTDQGGKVGPRVGGHGDRRQRSGQLTEPNEEELADEPGLVSEQLVDRGNRRAGIIGDVLGREPLHPTLGQRRLGGDNHSITQFGCALSWTSHDSYWASG